VVPMELQADEAVGRPGDGHLLWLMVKTLRTWIALAQRDEGEQWTIMQVSERLTKKHLRIFSTLHGGLLRTSRCRSVIPKGPDDRLGHSEKFLQLTPLRRQHLHTCFCELPLVSGELQRMCAIPVAPYLRISSKRN